MHLPQYLCNQLYFFSLFFHVDLNYHLESLVFSLRLSFRISRKVSLPATNSPSFCLYGNVLFGLLFLKDSFDGHMVLCLTLVSSERFASSHRFLVSTVSGEGVSCQPHLSFLIEDVCFSLAVFKTFSAFDFQHFYYCVSVCRYLPIHPTQSSVSPTAHVFLPRNRGGGGFQPLCVQYFFQFFPLSLLCLC